MREAEISFDAGDDPRIGGPAVLVDAAALDMLMDTGGH